MGERIIQVVPDLKSLAVAAAERIIEMSDDAKGRHESFSIALSGGNTPKTLFELLATDEYSERIDWNHWEIYWGDERCVPPNDPESNFGMAARALLDHVPIPPQNIHRMKGELDPQKAAIEYGQLLKEKFGDGGMNLILLGMGDDGHTASMFPGSDGLDAAFDTHSPLLVRGIHPAKLDSTGERMSLTLRGILDSRLVIILIRGDAKLETYRVALAGDDVHEMPVRAVLQQSVTPVQVYWAP